MRVLGIDPGLTRCGLGVVESAPGHTVRLCAVGVARSPADNTLDQRLLAIGDALEQWMETHRPDVVAIEQVFAQHNVRTVAGTAQVCGIAVFIAARRGIEVALHTPTEVKAAVTGNGGADKAQVQSMVRRILKLTQTPKPADAADALALAICHIWRPGGALRAGGDGQLTTAQRRWAAAERAARRPGAGQPRC